MAMLGMGDRAQNVDVMIKVAEAGTSKQISESEAAR
jgi:hypothetical protein